MVDHARDIQRAGYHSSGRRGQLCLTSEDDEVDLQAVFDQQARASRPAFSVSFSYVEILKEEVYDLMIDQPRVSKSKGRWMKIDIRRPSSI